MPSRPCCTPDRPSGAAYVAEKNNQILQYRICVIVSRYLAGGRCLEPLIAGDSESPLARKRVRSLWSERGAICIGQFRRFVEATKYVTLAERSGWSFVFYRFVPGGAEGTFGVEGME